MRQGFFSLFYFQHLELLVTHNRSPGKFAELLKWSFYIPYSPYLHSQGFAHIFKYSLQSLFLREQSLFHSSVLSAKEIIIKGLACFSTTMFSEANDTPQVSCPETQSQYSGLPVWGVERHSRRLDLVRQSSGSSSLPFSIFAFHRVCTSGGLPSQQPNASSHQVPLRDGFQRRRERPPPSETVSSPL